MTKIYLIQVKTPNKLEFKEELIIESGDIKKIKNEFRSDAKLRFFEIKEVKK